MLGIAPNPLASSVNSVSSASSDASTSSASSSSSTGTAYQTAPLSSTSRPHSHHRRKSSVSTRRESAEIMGVSLPTAAEEDMSGCSTDEIRKKALLALEGRAPILSGFAKVEIPDWSTPTAENQTFSWDLSNGPNFGTNMLAGKRDSFGRNMAGNGSTKNELGTLVEEDEEEEDGGSSARPSSNMVPVTQVTKPTPHRTRPASLNMSTLRRLSLVGDLPTPSSTPSPRNSASGIRPLTLIPSPAGSSTTPSPTPSTRPASMSLLSSPVSPSPITPRGFVPTPSPSPAPATKANRRHSLGMGVRRDSDNGAFSVAAAEAKSLNEFSFGAGSMRTPRSSVSSRASIHSIAERPSSPFDLANQIYTAQNHASLLDRIANLEEALAVAQATPTSSASTSSEELIALVAELKAERDALASSLEKARADVSEHERVADLVKKRLETARKEAWGERDRAEALAIEVDRLRTSLIRAEAETARTKVQGEEARGRLEESIMELRAELDEAVRARDIARVELDKAMSTANTMAQARRSFFGANTSVDSYSSTVVESVDSPLNVASKRKDLAAVAEEEDNTRSSSEGDDLDSYENEPTDFAQFIAAANAQDDDANDFDEEDLDEESEGEAVTALRIVQPIVKAVATTSLPSSPVDQPQHARAPSHSRKTSLVVGWKFPKSGPTIARTSRVSVSLRNSPRFTDDENDGSPISPLNLSSPPPKKKTPTLVEVTPALEEGFAMNFGGDDSFTSFASESFMPLGERQNEPVRASVPSTPVKTQVQKDVMRKEFAFPKSTPGGSSVSTPMRAPVRPTVVTPGSLVPPPSNKTPEYKLASIIPLVPNATVESSSRRQTPVTPVFTPAPSSSTSSSSSAHSSARPRTPTSSQDEDSSFSFSAPETKTKSPAAPAPRPSSSLGPSSALDVPASKNVVNFPTSSPSPFSMMSSLGSLAASYMPWSPRKENGPSPLPSPMFVANGAGGSQQANAGARPALHRGPSQQSVNPDVQREKLRARLMQEGKLPQTPSSSGKRVVS